MRRTLCAAVVAVLGFGADASAQWEDQFDSYNLGRLSTQSDWEQWSGSNGVDASVVAMPTLTSNRSVLITGQPGLGGTSGNDVVYDFSNLAGGQPTTGTWILTASSYVPTGATGIGWIIMLNQYPTPMNWSLQQNFDATNGQFVPNEPAGVTVPLIFDEWVPVVAAIDLDNDRLDIWYGDDLVVDNGLWLNGGIAQIACLDLYGGEPAANGISELYYDNVRLEKTGPGMALVSSPSPVPDGGSLTLDLEAPQAKNGRGFLYIWDVNGISLRNRLLNVTLDANGEWSLPATLPTGLSGLEIGMKAFCIPQGGGKINESNTDLIVIN